MPDTLWHPACTTVPHFAPLSTCNTRFSFSNSALSQYTTVVSAGADNGEPARSARPSARPQGRPPIVPTLVTPRQSASYQRFCSYLRARGHPPPSTEPHSRSAANHAGSDRGGKWGLLVERSGGRRTAGWSANQPPRRRHASHCGYRLRRLGRGGDRQRKTGAPHCGARRFAP